MKKGLIIGIIIGFLFTFILPADAAKKYTHKKLFKKSVKIEEKIDLMQEDIDSIISSIKKDVPNKDEIEIWDGINPNE